LTRMKSRKKKEWLGVLPFSDKNGEKKKKIVGGGEKPLGRSGKPRQLEDTKWDGTLQVKSQKGMGFAEKKWKKKDRESLAHWGWEKLKRAKKKGKGGVV